MPTFPAILSDTRKAYRLMVIGLRETYRPEVVEQRGTIGSYISIRSTSDEPKLVLNFNVDGEFSATSERQLGSITGEVSIPALLGHLYEQGELAVKRNRGAEDDASAELRSHMQFYGPVFAALSKCTVDFSEMTYNALVCLGGPGLTLLTETLHQVEMAMLRNGTISNPILASKQLEMPLRNKTVIAIEELLSRCRSLVPREPDNAISHYFSYLPEVIEKQGPPQSILNAIMSAGRNQPRM